MQTSLVCLNRLNSSFFPLFRRFAHIQIATQTREGGSSRKGRVVTDNNRQRHTHIMGAKPSTANGGPQSPQRTGAFSTGGNGGSSMLRTIHVSTADRQRARSLSAVPDDGSQEAGGGGGAIAIAFPGANVQYDMSVSPDSSSAEDSANAALGRVYTSLPSHIQWSLNGEFPCPNLVVLYHSVACIAFEY